MSILIIACSDSSRQVLDQSHDALLRKPKMHNKPADCIVRLVFAYDHKFNVCRAFPAFLA
jgi:hypothetical protein